MPVEVRQCARRVCVCVVSCLSYGVLVLVTSRLSGRPSSGRSSLRRTVLVHLSSTRRQPPLAPVSLGGLAALSSLCSSPHPTSQCCIGCALANSATSPACHHEVVEHGGLQALTTLVASEDPDVMWDNRYPTPPYPLLIPVPPHRLQCSAVQYILRSRCYFGQW